MVGPTQNLIVITHNHGGVAHLDTAPTSEAPLRREKLNYNNIYHWLNSLSLAISHVHSEGKHHEHIVCTRLAAAYFLHICAYESKNPFVCPQQTILHSSIWVTLE